MTWTFTNSSGDSKVVVPTEGVTLEPKMGFGEFSIPNFQAGDSGNYSCSISVLNGDNVLGGITSAEKTVKLAGKETVACVHIY